jgi:hypothetical protein
MDGCQMKKVQNKILVLAKILLLLFLLLFLRVSSKEAKDFNVIFISLDTTRYDYIDTGRGAKAFTPELKKFSQDSFVFENAFSVSPQTLPSHLAVFTSHLPYDLGVLCNEDSYDGRHKMIQQVFQELGYHSAAIISLGTLGSGTGLEKSFREFKDDLFEDGIFFAPAEKITSEAINLLPWIRNKKFFLFVHYSDPHTPYAPPDVEGLFEMSLDGKLVAEFNSYRGAILKKAIPISEGNHILGFRVKHDFENFSHFIIRGLEASQGCSVDVDNLVYSKEIYGGSHLMRRPESQVNIRCQKEGYLKIFQIIPILKKQAALELYRKEVEYMDLHIGKFLDTLEKSGLMKKTIIVIFGDHGEGHGERENFFGHTRFLNRQFIHVPLVMRLPGEEGRRINDPISLLCISPAILEFLGIRDESFNLRESILKGIQKGEFKDKSIFSSTFNPSTKLSKLSIIKWPFQGIFYLEQGINKKSEFYNLNSSLSYSEGDAIPDDEIRKNSGQCYRHIQKRFNQVKSVISHSSDRKDSLDKEKKQKLRSLGYLDFK